MSNRASRPRTLTQMLREWDDDALSYLLIARSDLAVPQPTDFSQIASRATTRHSVSQALDLLNAFELWVAENASAVASSPLLRGDAALNRGAEGFAGKAFASSAAHGLADSSGAGGLNETELQGVVLAALERLSSLALLWGDEATLRPVRAMASMLTSDPGPAPSPYPPSVGEGPRQAADLVDKVAAGSVFECVRRVDVLVEHCDHQPAVLTKAGGLAQREARALGSLLDLPTAAATLHLDLARCAGLLGESTLSGTMLVPTIGFDSWQSMSLAGQWRNLATGWLDRHAASGPRWLKELCLQGFNTSGEPLVLSADTLRPYVRWQRPRASSTVERQIAVLLEQAAWLGITGLGAVSSPGAHVVTSAEGAGPSADANGGKGALAALQLLLPHRVDQVLVQADLTAIAPGPLAPEAAKELGQLAEIESRGGATVYRFSTASLKRAYQLGWQVDDIMATLEKRSSTPLPQPLRYLVKDLDRQASRAPEPAVAADAASPALSTQTPSGRSEPTAHSTPLRAPVPQFDLESEQARVHQSDALAVVQSLRTSETSSAEQRSAQPQAFPSSDARIDSPLAVLREAVETAEVVWFGYVDTRGASGERLVHALAVDEGRLHARDARSDEALNVPLHRITAAHIIRRSG
ncbi:MAG: helicase-associated domain-containing protein [Nocardioidaceae bacterium]